MLTTMFNLTFSLLVAISLAGCATPGSFTPQQSTITDVRARMGSPTDIRFAPDGDELWEYATGPRGTETYLFRFAKDGRVKAVTQLLTEEQFGKIIPGQTTKTAVRDLLGQPSALAFLPNGTAWSWHVRVGTRDGQFVVRFGRDNVVVEKNVVFDTAGKAGTSDNSGLLGNPLLK
jgi:outer membrane protein assembly factor BamE (lipoprotein component of BamABCDE complex)